MDIWVVYLQNSHVDTVVSGHWGLQNTPPFLNRTSKRDENKDSDVCPNSWRGTFGRQPFTLGFPSHGRMRGEGTTLATWVCPKIRGFNSTIQEAAKFCGINMCQLMTKETLKWFSLTGFSYVFCQPKQMAWRFVALGHAHHRGRFCLTKTWIPRMGLTRWNPTRRAKPIPVTWLQEFLEGLQAFSSPQNSRLQGVMPKGIHCSTSKQQLISNCLQCKQKRFYLEQRISQAFETWFLYSTLR